MRTTKRKPTHYALLVVCLALVYYWGVTSLTAEPMAWFSEWHTLKHLYDSPVGSSYTLAETITSVSIRSSDHGPLYFILLNFWHDLVGRDLATFRVLSVFFGLLALAFVYRLALTAGDNDIALDAVIFLTFLSNLVYHTQKVRMYSLLPMLAALVAWWYWKIIRTRGHVPSRHWLVLIVGAAALVAVHYFGIVLLGAIGGYHLLFVKKDRRWYAVCLAMAAAAILFSPWLPVVWKALTTSGVPDSERLLLLDSIAAIIGLYTNGLYWIAPLALLVIIARYRQLGQAQRYILFLTCVVFLLVLLINEFTPVIIARRIRYTIVWGVPYACALAIALSLAPQRKLIRLLFFTVWIPSFFLYNNSADFLLYTNRLTEESRQAHMPHFQDFIYKSQTLPGNNELILSFHPSGDISARVLDHYRKALTTWAHIVHISYNTAGELNIQSGLSTYESLEAILANARSLWLVHNPQQTDLKSMPVFTDWFTANYQLCQRFWNTDDNIVDYYVWSSIPCDLVASERPFGIRYDSGAELGNFLYEQTADELRVFLWWARSLEDAYSLTLQTFDASGEKVQQLDAVISGEPIDIFNLDLSALPAGEYVIKLIVYDRLTLESQQGTIVANDRRFDRALDLIEFSIPG